MSRIVRIVAVGGLCLSALAARAEPLNAKPGAWEMTITTTMSGDVIPPEALAKMPAERRAAVEKMLAEKAGQPSSTTRKSCVRKEDLEQDRFLRNTKDTTCTIAHTTRTSTKLVAVRTCKGPPPSESTYSFEAQTPESVTGSIDTTRGTDGKLHIAIEGRWLGASCKGIEPLTKR